MFTTTTKPTKVYYLSIN